MTLVKSPSLATSELGEMSRVKLVQAIITNDFRVFLFGAETLIERQDLLQNFDSICPLMF